MPGERTAGKEVGGLLFEIGSQGGSYCRDHEMRAVREWPGWASGEHSQQQNKQVQRP